MFQFLVETTADLRSSSGAAFLQEVLRAVEPAAILVPPWLMQNLIAHDRRPGESRFRGRHRKIYLISRHHFLTLAKAEGWAIPPSIPQADTLILLTRPELQWMEQRQWPEVLRHYWQLLFHAGVYLEFDQKLAGQRHDDAAIQRRIERIGRSSFHEASFVLQREQRLAADADPHLAYVEFGASYLELYHFQPNLLSAYFPAIADPAAILTILRDDIDDRHILRKTRLPGAGEIPCHVAGSALTYPEVGSGSNKTSGSGLTPATHPPGRTLRDAERAAAAGNHVGAAILRRRLAMAAADADANLSPDLDTLLVRLTAALGLSEPEISQWRFSLGLLLDDAADVSWNPAARLLYDLQKVCLNHERELYSVGVIDWLLEFCRRPLRRAQPNQRVVLMCKALRSAGRRVANTRLASAQQLALIRLIDEAFIQTELRLRIHLRPVIARSLTAAGLRPANAPERVAENKAIEELLDGLEHRGFLTLGRVRDIVSSNQIKFDDIADTHTFFTTDPLFRIDRQLSDNLDGIYHRGEIYLRFFQKISSVFFATRFGRSITRTVLIPIGGSFIIVEGLDHTLFLLFRFLTGCDWYKLSQFEEFRRDSLGLFLLENMTFFVLALMLFGAVNSFEFRKATFVALRKIARGFGHVLIDTPRWIASRPLVQAMAGSRAARLVGRYVAKPLTIAGLAVLFMPHRAGHGARWMVLASVFVCVNLLLNSQAGRAIERVVMHWLRVLGAHVTSDILGNLFSGIMHFFAKRLEEFERMLYAVDEWLRFRHGQRHGTLLLKALLGIFWFYIAYTARFAVNLLVEPQINPIKHFPVVTVSHKIVFPTIGVIAQAIKQLGISTVRSRTLAAAIVTTIPGIFGFLAWELRSNWKLYCANRPPTLRPIQIGSHGETMARLLRPGFHSGTIPKIFARLRRSQVNHIAGNPPSPLHDEAYEHVAQAIEHFIERELIFRLNEHPAWTATPISLASIWLGPTRVLITIACPTLSTEPAEIFFEQRAGWILAGIDRASWIDHLDANQAGLFAAALLGLYKIAGVDVVKEQIERLFMPGLISFDILRRQLLVWPDRKFDQPTVFPIGDSDANLPQATEAQRFMFKFVSITWEDWVRVWEPTATDSSIASGWAMIVLPVAIRSI